MYQRVQRVEGSFPRPVLILGPLVEASKDMLVKEAPAQFCRCLPGEPEHTEPVTVIRVYLFMKDSTSVYHCHTRDTYQFELYNFFQI